MWSFNFVKKKQEEPKKEVKICNHKWVVIGYYYKVFEDGYGTTFDTYKSMLCTQCNKIKDVRLDSRLCKYGATEFEQSLRDLNYKHVNEMEQLKDKYFYKIIDLEKIPYLT